MPCRERRWQLIFRSAGEARFCVIGLLQVPAAMHVSLHDVILCWRVDYNLFDLSNHEFANLQQQFEHGRLPQNELYNNIWVGSWEGE